MAKVVWFKREFYFKILNLIEARVYLCTLLDLTRYHYLITAQER